MYRCLVLKWMSSILLIARMYHLKVAVLMEKTYWTTLLDNNLNNVEIFITCTDKLTLSDTKPMDSDHPTPLPPVLPQKLLAGNPRLHKKWAGIQTRSLTDCLIWTSKHQNSLILGKSPVTALPKAPAKPKRLQKPTGKPTPGKPSKPGLQVQTYTIRKYIPRKRDFKCPAARKCKETYPSQANVNVHIKNTYPNFWLQCSYCTAKYKTYNAAYKHKRAHSGPKHEC